MKFFKKSTVNPSVDETGTEIQAEESLTDANKSLWQKVFPVFAGGAGLFSDGYLNNVSHSAIESACDANGNHHIRLLAPSVLSSAKSMAIFTI